MPGLDRNILVGAAFGDDVHHVAARDVVARLRGEDHGGVALAPSLERLGAVELDGRIAEEAPSLVHDEELEARGARGIVDGPRRRGAGCRRGAAPGPCGYWSRPSNSNAWKLESVRLSSTLSKSAAYWPPWDPTLQALAEIAVDDVGEREESGVVRARPHRGFRSAGRGPSRPRRSCGSRRPG